MLALSPAEGKGAQQVKPKASQQVKPYESGIVWAEPKMVTPGTHGSPPSDAVVLFDGKNMDAWTGGDKWTLENGVGTAKSAVTTKQKFGDCQLHVEFASPKEVRGSGQGRGNNGIGLAAARYEIQVLDSWNNPTYFDGQCAAIYKQHPPLVNASLPPGEWQTYDIVFEIPRFEGEKLAPSRLRDCPAQWTAGAEPRRAARGYALRSRSQIHAAPRKNAADAYVPQQPRPVPQHLESGGSGVGT